MTGVVATEGGNAAAGRQVIIAPQGGFQNRRDLVKMVSTDRDGRFQITDIAPGEYEIVAIDGSDASLRSAEYRRFFEDRFDRVTVHPASHENVNVSLLSIQDFQRIRSQIP
jgi:ethanolamine utilization microcompartment shell protein EutS